MEGNEFTVAQAAKFANVSIQTLYNWFDQGLSSRRVRGRHRRLIKKSDLTAFINCSDQSSTTNLLKK